MQTEIDQSNFQLAVQIANQLANAVVSLAGRQIGAAVDTVDGLPLAGLLSLEPFAEQLKSKNKDSFSKFDPADSALATLKGIKGLAEICPDDPAFQNNLVDSGILCLLRLFLLSDDYEKLAAIEAYDASRVLEAQEWVSSAPGEASVLDLNDPSSVRVPPAGHIRRHAAQLLTILSVLPKVQKIVASDGIWCKWLVDCANGKVPGCNDLKVQSYARATQLNILCCKQTERNALIDGCCDMENETFQKNLFPCFDDMIFLINPELQHWKFSKEDASSTSRSDASGTGLSMSLTNSPSQENEDLEFFTSSRYVDVSNGNSQAAVPSVDIVFVHGLRGGSFKIWRIADNKSSTTSKAGLVEKIYQEAGKQGTCWPKEWLATDLPQARLFTVKYKVCALHFFSSLF